MSEKMHPAESLTRNKETAKKLWDILKVEIERSGRADILENPTVLDLGGGMGEFSKYLNADKTKCVSLEKRKVKVVAEANPVRADAYSMPFSDESFDIIYSRGSLDAALYPHNLPLLLQEMVRVLKKKGIFFTWDNTELNLKEVRKYFKEISKGPSADIVGVWEKI